MISQWQQLLAPEGEIVAVHEPDIDPQSQFSGGKISMIAEDVFQVYDKADIWNSVFTNEQLDVPASYAEHPVPADYKDIALLKLKKKIPYTDKTRPACLPNKDDEPITNELCYASGWGAHYCNWRRWRHSSENGSVTYPTFREMSLGRWNSNEILRWRSFWRTWDMSRRFRRTISMRKKWEIGSIWLIKWNYWPLCKTNKELDTAKDLSNGKKAVNLGQPLDSDETTDAKQAGKVTEPFPCGLSAFPMKKEESSSNRFKPGNGTTLILTAAHCIYDSNRRKVLEPQKIEALVGAHNVYKLDEETRKQVLVKSVIMHPKYNDKTLENDIALLQLRETVFYTTITRPACLPKPGEKLLPTTSC
ncbi:Mast cell protease 1A [Trichinella pseudospiralis]